MNPADRDASDRKFMARALELAGAMLGRTAPNPAVGCVITFGGPEGETVLAEAATGAGGRPHAEEQAVSMLAGAEFSKAGLTVYVTLEPCAARSQTGHLSCAARIAALAPGRVVIAALDPHFDPTSDATSDATGLPARRPALVLLEEAGVRVETGVLETEALALNIGFLTHLRTGRPHVAVDSRAELYDAPFTLAPLESFEDALNRMGKAGLTRICVVPGSALAAQLLGRGLASRPG